MIFSRIQAAVTRLSCENREYLFCICFVYFSFIYVPPPHISRFIFYVFDFFFVSLLPVYFFSSSADFQKELNRILKSFFYNCCTQAAVTRLSASPLKLTGLTCENRKYLFCIFFVYIFSSHINFAFTFLVN